MSGTVVAHSGVARTLIQSLVHERHLTRQEVIKVLERRARTLDIGDFALSLRQIDRWFAGNVATSPRPSVCRVIEAEFGFPVAELLAPDGRFEHTGSGRSTGLVPSPIAASQDEWRSVRRHLNGNRAHLADIAAGLYHPEVRVPDTSLLAHADWMPSAPTPLEYVALRWETGTSVTIDGTEPEARAHFPLRTSDYYYDRYTAAIRYLEAPTLFENRPSYRLLQVGWNQSSGGELVFGPAAYFDKLDICETLGHEFAAAWLTHESDASQTAAIGWRHLPLRRVIGDPFDLSTRAVIPAITTLTLIRAADGTTTFLLHWRDPTKVATAGGLYDVIPAGEFQPASVSPYDIANDFDLWRNIVREYSEELLGTPEHDGSRSHPIDYERWPLYRGLQRARTLGTVRAFCFGVGFDALTLAATIPTVVVIDENAFEELFGEVVHANAEGIIITGEDNNQQPGKTTGIPFTADTVQRFLTSEPMAPPGAACLAMAWRHRDLLLAR
jgi:hypothetical protein